MKRIADAISEVNDCRPDPTAKFKPFHKIVAGLLEVKKLIADLDALEPELKRLRKTSLNNRNLIEISHKCGCFYCLRTFAPTDVIEWTDEGRTALCPKCGLDCVLAVVPDLAILPAMNLWFLSGIQEAEFALCQKDGEPEYFHTR